MLNISVCTFDGFSFFPFLFLSLSLAICCVCGKITFMRKITEIQIIVKNMYSSFTALAITLLNSATQKIDEYFIAEIFHWTSNRCSEFGNGASYYGENLCFSVNFNAFLGWIENVDDTKKTAKLTVFSKTHCAHI